MDKLLIEWILGCLFGIIIGWLITWTYYKHKIRKIIYDKGIINERDRQTRKV